MRKSGSISLLLCILFLLLTSGQLQSQYGQRGGGQHRVTGWVDDTHFIFQTLDKDNKSVTLSVEVKTGKSVPYTAPKSERDLLGESLPKGTSLSFTDIMGPDMKSVVFVKDNDLYYFRMGDKEVTRLTNDKTEEVNTRFSPDGTKLAYTKNKDMYVYNLTTRKEIRLTTDASDKIYNGYSSWVYNEEIFERPSRYAAFWWSPDSKKLAYMRTDESDVPVFTLNRLDEADGINGKLELVPYPKPGDPNPKVKIGVADLATEKTSWVKTDYNADLYLAWPFWKPDGSKLVIQVLNRNQNDMKFILADPSTGDFIQIYSETRKSWIEFYEDIYVMKNGSGFIVRSYRSDWENLYYYGWDGRLVSQLTNVNWNVNAITRVDEDTKMVYFTGTGPESTDNHFFRVGLDGKNLLQMTKEPGSHNVSISPKGTYFIDSWNSITSTGTIVAYSSKGQLVR
jgi:dipeptidyl-peptidase-4